MGTDLARPRSFKGRQRPVDDDWDDVDLHCVGNAHRGSRQSPSRSAQTRGRASQGQQVEGERASYRRRWSHPAPTTEVVLAPASSLDPVGLQEKSWRFNDYFWLASSLALSPPAYMLGVLGSHLGLTWKWSVLASFLSALLAAGLAALTMHAPSKYGIPFCVSARTSFGIFGAKFFSLLHLGLAFPWTAWLLSIATEGLREGITRFRPSVATWNPLPPSFLPPGQSSLLSLLCLASSFLLLVSLHAFGKIQALRSLAPVLSTLLLAFYVGLGIWAYRLLGLDTGLHAYDAKSMV
ncbi:ncs1 nucleoside transporter family [Nannochloropsis gaditana CCMP526]|uniref:ncs1 nucleoside transporter family n=1 Tax=Nannochloropsis gaditana (strain CCMP526) TaxID=1093141 RepID=UPI00029F6C33|nr:ncs1 nucleoside transporter family [Nannochloropsis gaditana CCMP526]EKU21194.1 ncs1 nucleoside transporter family [Nannochloropsis gaditana CCMP526]|eukprot:XP_005855170.1 ncs1 nucleoside transporter family [Nannochloropsis gaditana CCMP526]